MPINAADLPDALDINCLRCGGALTAQVGPPDGRQTYDNPVPWTCPYCGAQHAHDFGGPLHWIAPRSGTRGPH